MKLVVVFKSLGSSNSHIDDYRIIECGRWTVSKDLLIIIQNDKVRYMPLGNIESFYELNEAVEE